jgi:zinc protease
MLKLFPRREAQGRRRHAAAPGVLFLVLLLWAWGPAPLQAADAPDPFAGVVEAQLPNSLKVLILKESRAPLISLQVWYKVGSRNEDFGKTGISHLTEHLMFRGTARYGAKVFSREVQKAGGTDNAFTGRDYTAYFENGPKTELKRWLEMEADRMKGLSVTPEGFNTEKKVVLEERRLRTDDDPVSYLLEETRAAAFTAHPYHWPVIGWFHDIESITREDFLKYYHRYYQPNNCTVVVAGDVDPQEALKLVEATFGQLAQGPEPPQVTAVEPRQYGERRVTVRREAQLPYVVMLYHVPNWRQPDAYPLELLSRVLSQGRSSRLYQRLVYQDRLALEAGADYDFDTADPTVFTLYGQPLPGKSAAQLEAALNREIKRLQTELVSATELQKAKNQVQASFYMSLDSLFYRGMILGRLATVARWDLVREFIPKILQVTPEDLRRVARDYLKEDNRTVGVLVPIKTDKPVVERFRPGGQVE